MWTNKTNIKPMPLWTVWGTLNFMLQGQRTITSIVVVQPVENTLRRFGFVVPESR